MTVKDVRNYRFLERSIRIAMQHVDELREKPSLADKVSGSNPEYPYELRSFTVEGMESLQYTKQSEALKVAMSECRRLVSLKQEIDEAAAVLTEEPDRTIWSETMGGKTQEEIAEKLSIDQSTVSRRLTYICDLLSDK